MKNHKILNKILTKLEKNHINLYHSISKDELKNFIHSLPNIDSLSNIKFDKIMLEIFAKFKDAHTTYKSPKLRIDNEIFFIQNKFYLQEDKNFFEIEKFGNLTPNEYINKIEKLSAYETQEHLNALIRDEVLNKYTYKMLELNNDDEVSLSINNNGVSEIRKINVDFNTSNYKKKKKINYYYKIINDILYIKYLSCINMEEYPFNNFVDDVETEINEKNLKKYILDLRDNTGGNSSIINPLTNLIANKQMQGAMLINNQVFSSGRFAVRDFKRECNAYMIGEGTGGAATSYGYSGFCRVADKDFVYSKRFFDLSQTFGSTGAIQPDLKIEQTIEDIKNNNDRQLNEAIAYVNRIKKYDKEKSD